MAKIILASDNAVLQEMTLSKERVTIGRRPGNDIVIDNLAISSQHAVIVTINNDSFLEDLNSTNGTQINGQPVKKHFLQDNDVIELAQYKLRYVADSNHEADSSEEQKGLASGDRRREGTVRPGTTATIKVLNGLGAGQEIALIKVLTTLGRPGTQVAVVARRPQGYYLTHVEGRSYPLVNGQPIGAGAHPMTDGDVIDLSGTQMQFSLT